MHSKQAFAGVVVTALFLLLLLLAEGKAESNEAAVATTTIAAAATADGKEEMRKLVKRAPTNSFIGMRGKKEADEDNWQDQQEQQPQEQQLDPLLLDYADDYENGRRLKKAPLAFVGVRGKKYTQGGSRLGDLLASMEEQRLRETLLQDILEQLTGENADMVKRAPTGFTGMRGKRLNELDDTLSAETAELEKRAPVNAFVGVRGKKDVSHQHYKRAALNEAYDVRGKKQRYADFNSKFVAVRGKKSSDTQYEDEDEHNARAHYLLRPWAYELSSLQQKRAPNGFVGMRGKRPALVE